MSIQLVDVNIYVKEYLLNDAINVAKKFNINVMSEENKIYVTKTPNETGYYRIAIFVNFDNCDDFYNELTLLETKDDKDLVMIV